MDVNSHVQPIHPPIDRLRDDDTAGLSLCCEAGCTQVIASDKGVRDADT
jgi:hypothetical protein